MEYTLPTHYDCPLRVSPNRIIDAAKVPVLAGWALNCSLADIIANADYGEPEIGEGLLDLPNHQAWPVYHPDIPYRLLGVISEDPQRGLWFTDFQIPPGA